MSRHFRTLACPMLTDADHWIFAGALIDAKVAHSEREAAQIADDLNSDRQRYSVVRFNAVEGTCRDVTHEFIPDEDDDLPEYPAHDRACSAADRAHQYRKEAM